jgi:excinuclease UvrABC nuclease subunit
LISWTMADRQLRLFPHSKPLLDRFGSEFFAAVPKKPGVYVMTSSTGQILYVGQSRNLRSRLGTYRNANPEHLPRRIVRMVHLVASITWEECQTGRLAKVRENELLRLLRPRFNRANTFPQAYCFLGMRTTGRRLDLYWTRDGESRHDLFGAFKSGVVYAFGALCRLLWSALNQPKSAHELPRQLITGRTPTEFTFEFSTGNDRHDVAATAPLLNSFLAGESDELLRWLETGSSFDQLLQFHQNLVRADLETLANFFETGAKRLRRLKFEHGVDDGIVFKEELDDLLALSATTLTDLTNTAAS